MNPPSHPPALRPAPTNFRVAEAANPSLPLVFGLLLVYVFIRYSMFHEMLLFRFGIDSKYNYVFGPLLLLLAVASGSMRKALTTTPGICIVGFTLSLAMSIPTSVWRSGSLEIFKGYLQGALPLFFFIPALMTSVAHFRSIAVAMAISGLFIYAYRPSLEERAGRLVLDFGSLGNPNDLAIHLLLILPFCFFLLADRPRTSLAWWLAFLSAGVLTVLALQTGSRGGLLTLVAVAGMALLQLPWKFRIPLAFVAVLAGLLFFGSLPESARVRYMMMFSDDVVTDSRVAEYAASSSESRRQMLFRAIEETIAHPLFGVGAGQFAVAESAESKSRGERAEWIQAHNAYTQVSSEVGIPGFLFYIGVLVSCFTLLRRVIRAATQFPELVPVRRMASAVLLCLGAYCVGTIFDHLAYRMYLPMVAGFAVAVSLIFEREIQSVQSRSITGVPARAPWNRGYIPVSRPAGAR